MELTAEAIPAYIQEVFISTCSLSSCKLEARSFIRLWGLTKERNGENLGVSSLSPLPSMMNLKGVAQERYVKKKMRAQSGYD